MKLISLTQGKFARVDDEDYKTLSCYRWHAQKQKGDKYYAYRKNKGRQLAMHNQILGIKGVDHKNGEGLDNQRENLRPANKSQNKMNCSPKNGKRFKGTIKKSTGSWESRIRINNKLIYIGYFKEEEEAAKAYDVKAKALFGEFARLNFLS